MGSDGSNRLTELAKQLTLSNPVEEARISSNSVDSVTERTRGRRAAVLVCIFQGNSDDDLRVILTKRASTLSSHSGEVSLPGGKSEEGDADDIATALREAKEEIGLDPKLVHVVSLMNPITTKNGMMVVPVIGILYDKNAFKPAPNPAEVETIFDVPLEMFLKDENRTEEEREWMGTKYVLHFFNYETQNKNYVIWALTAGILINASSIVYQKQPAFLEKKPEFWSKA